MEYEREFEVGDIVVCVNTGFKHPNGKLELGGQGRHLRLGKLYRVTNANEWSLGIEPVSGKLPSQASGRAARVRFEKL